jgi:hypothetical protein
MREYWPQVFGQAAFEQCGQYFRMLRFTSEDAGKHKQVRMICPMHEEPYLHGVPLRSHVTAQDNHSPRQGRDDAHLPPYMSIMHGGAGGAQILQFSFAMPPAGEMAAIGRWMTAVMAFIDAVGQYKLRPEQKVRGGSIAAPKHHACPGPSAAQKRGIQRARLQAHAYQQKLWAAKTPLFVHSAGLRCRISFWAACQHGQHLSSD